MILVSITRLRIRAWRYMPAFAVHTMRTLAQIRRADGYLSGSLLADRKLTFWTVTLWREPSDMKRYMSSGAHLRAMPKLLNWCDEASVLHWQQDNAVAPDWLTADRRMRDEGRPSKVRHPSARHRDLTFDGPRTTGAVPIRPLA